MSYSSGSHTLYSNDFSGDNSDDYEPSDVGIVAGSNLRRHILEGIKDRLLQEIDMEKEYMLLFILYYF